MAIAVSEVPCGGMSEIKEQCALCMVPTLHWYTQKDVAVCQSCAATATPEMVPSKKSWLEAVRGKKLPDGWQCAADRRRNKDIENLGKNLLLEAA